MNTMHLMSDVTRYLAEGGDWCSVEKAHALAALVVGLRPRVVCEIGVWMGGSLVPMAFALRLVREVEVAAGRPGDHKIIAIDPWAASESCVGQGGADAAWWAEVDHETAMQAFLGRLDRHRLSHLVDVRRSTSDAAEVPEMIDILHVDGNHAEQARRDVARFAPSVRQGGILLLDDLNWQGGHVLRSWDLARELGFRDLYPIGTGVAMQRTSSPAIQPSQPREE